MKSISVLRPAQKVLTAAVVTAATATCLMSVSTTGSAAASVTAAVGITSFAVGGLSHVVDGTNIRRASDFMVAYTPSHGATTGTNRYGTEVAVVNGKVTRKASNVGNMAIPAGGYVLSGQGTTTSGIWLREHADVGMAVALRTPTPVPATTVKIGMAPGPSDWDARVSETGAVFARRLFDDLGSPDFAIRTATTEVAAGRLPVLSFKIPGDDWAGVAAGKYDTQLRAVTTSLAALKGRVFVTLHHEPSGDGTATNYAAMMRHALPILGAPTNVDAGPIVNGYWWSSKAMGYTDAEIAQWLPTSVLAVSEVVAADTYQGGTVTALGEDAATKIVNLRSWATRVGVKRLGIGEYNGLTAASIKAAGDAVLADPRFAFANIYNSNFNNREGVSWLLTGDRLAAFKATVSASAAGQS